MEQNEHQFLEEVPKKLKSLVAGRILSFVPLASIVLLLISLLLAPRTFSSAPSRYEQIRNNVSSAMIGFFMIMSSVPSVVCALIGLFFLLYARKKTSKNTTLFIVFSSIGMFLSVLITISFLLILRGFESTGGQLDKLSKIKTINEVVLTYDTGFHDGIMYNDLDLYLVDEKFLQVSDMSEYLTSFRLNAIGDWQLFSIHKDNDGNLEKSSYLTQEELSELFGTEIKKLKELIVMYDAFIKKVEELPLIEEEPSRTGFFKEPLQKEKLALREQKIYEDILKQQGVASVKKIEKNYAYLENYWYEVTMNDDHTFLMTVSAVFPQEDGSIKSSFYIRNFDGEPIFIPSGKNVTYGIDCYSPYPSSIFGKEIGTEMQSYREFFQHYEEFLYLTDSLLEQGRKAAEQRRYITWLI